jgi:hypothetical protein
MTKKQAKTAIKKAINARTSGLRLFTAAGRPTKAQFVKVYGKKGPAMTWEQRAEAGVSAEQFQAALAAKESK